MAIKKISKKTKKKTLDKVTSNVSCRGKKERQDLFIQYYVEANYNATAACKEIGLNRKQFNRWKNEDQDFVERLEEAQQARRDEIMGALMNQVRKQHIAAIIFSAKAICGLYEPTKQDITIQKKEPFLSNEESDRIVKVGLESMLTQKKYQKMLNLDTEPEEVPLN